MSSRARTFLIRLYPDRHQDLIARLEALRRERRVNQTVVDALRAYFSPSGPSPPQSPPTLSKSTPALPESLLEALRRLHPDTPDAGLRALAASEALGDMRTLFAAVPETRDVFDFNAPLLVEAARLLLRRAHAFYRQGATAPPDSLRLLLEATDFLLEDNHA